MNSIGSLETFSAVVENIYDAAIDTNLWHETLLRLRRFVGASSASLLYSGDVNADGAFPEILFRTGYSESFIQALTPESWSVWALQANIAAWKVGEVNHLADILPREEFLNGRFYREVLQPHQQLDFMGMMALREGPHFVHLNMSTTEEDGFLPPRSVELMRLLAPHMCRAAKIGLALDLKALQANHLEATLDSLGAGVFLTHEDGRVVFMNRAAEQQVKRGIGFRIAHGRLAPKDQVAAADFAANLAIPRAAGDWQGTGTVSIALPDETGGLIATILPLGGGRRQSLTTGAHRATFAVFVQDPAVTQVIPGEAIAKLYGLTPAELRVMLAVAPGNGSQDAADILGVSVATIRTHLQRIYRKTGVDRQADLVQLMIQASAPAAAGLDPPL